MRTGHEGGSKNGRFFADVIYVWSLTAQRPMATLKEGHNLIRTLGLWLFRHLGLPVNRSVVLQGSGRGGYLKFDEGLPKK